MVLVICGCLLSLFFCSVQSSLHKKLKYNTQLLYRFLPNFQSKHASCQKLQPVCRFWTVGLTDFGLTENCVVYNRHSLKLFHPVKLHLLCISYMILFEFVVFESHLMYNVQFSSVTIYKVGKRMMPSVLRSVQITKLCRVFQPG